MINTTDIGDGVPVTWTTGHAAPTSARPAMIVVPSIFGVAEDLQARMAELAEDGSLIAAFDPFWRVAPGVVPYDDVQAAFKRVGDVDRKQVYVDFQTVIAWARQNGGSHGRVAGLGICFGGPFCLIAAADGLIDGVVTWHGSQMHNWIARAAEMRVPMEHHFGAEDPVVPLEHVEQIRAAFAGHEQVTIVVHEGASHGFSHAGAAYQEKAALAGIDAARKMLTLLR